MCFVQCLTALPCQCLWGVDVIVVCFPSLHCNTPLGEENDLSITSLMNIWGSCYNWCCYEHSCLCPWCTEAHISVEYCLGSWITWPETEPQVSISGQVIYRKSAPWRNLQGSEGQRRSLAGSQASLLILPESTNTLLPWDSGGWRALQNHPGGICNF